jgi:hypothetical protein
MLHVRVTQAATQQRSVLSAMTMDDAMMGSNCTLQ